MHLKRVNFEICIGGPIIWTTPMPSCSHTRLLLCTAVGDVEIFLKIREWVQPLLIGQVTSTVHKSVHSSSG